MSERVEHQLAWDTDAWEDYLYWQQTNKQVLKRINELIRDCLRTPFDGIGKPELLKANLRGYWSRRITGEHRLVYQVDDAYLTIVQCRFHY
jgi:toxin YoeB